MRKESSSTELEIVADRANLSALGRRFDVRMSTELAQQLHELASENDMSRAEVFRRAIGLYKLAKSVTKRGGKVLLEEPGHNIRELVGI